MWGRGEHLDKIGVQPSKQNEIDNWAENQQCREPLTSQDYSEDQMIKHEKL